MIGVGRGYVIALLLVTAVVFVAACSDEAATPTASSVSDEAGGREPTVEIFTPTPSPMPTATPAPTFTPTPTPISFSVAVPLPPTATPRPTSTPDPDAPARYLEELLSLVEEQLPTTRLHPQSFLLDDGRILFAGGLLPTVGNNGLFFGGPNPSIETYDPGSDSWSLLDPIEPFIDFINAVKLANGDILILGIEQVAPGTEVDIESIPHAAYVLDGETLAPTRVSPPSAPRVSPDLVLMDDGRVAAIGGIDPLSESSIFDVSVSLAVEIYDPVLDSWVDAAAQPEGLTREFNLWEPDNVSQWVFPLPGARLLTLRVGEIPRNDDSSSQDAGRIELYDSTADTWESLATTLLDYGELPWHAILSTADVLTIIYQDRIEEFDPSTNEWSISYPPDSVILDVPEGEESFSFERHVLPRNASVTELPDGRLLAVGGERSRYSALPRAASILYNPDTKIWALGPKPAGPRAQHTAVVMDDGNVLLFGGFTIQNEDEDEGIPTNSLEIISATEIATVDTVTPRTTLAGTPLAPLAYPC